MKLLQTRLFSQQKKKLHANQIPDLDKAVNAISQNPKIDEQKLGDLTAINVYKFKMVTQECLLAYQILNDQIILHALDFKPGDVVTFEIKDHKAIISKIEPFDYSYHRALAHALPEWTSPTDDEAYHDL